MGLNWPRISFGASGFGSRLEFAPHFLGGIRLHVKTLVLGKATREEYVNDCLGRLPRCRFPGHRPQSLEMVHPQAQQAHTPDLDRRTTG